MGQVGGGETQIPVYVSYSWRTEELTGIVSALKSACEQRKTIRLLLDKETLGYGESIFDYMKRLGAGRYIIAVVSANFLESEYCMYEMLRVCEEGALEGRLMPVVLEGCPLSTSEELANWVRYWEDRVVNFDGQIKGMRQNHLSGQHNALDRMVEIRNSISSLLEFISSHKNITVNAAPETDFGDLLDRIERDARIESGTLVARPDEASSTSSTLMQSTQPVPSDILKKVRKLVSRAPLASHKSALFRRLGAPVSADLATQLCEQPLEDVISAITRGLDPVFERLSDQDRLAFGADVRELVATLTLLAVDRNRLDAVIKALRNEDSIITLSLRDDAGVEVLIAFAEERDPDFMTDGNDVRGRNHVDSRSYCEAGIGDEVNFEEFEQSVFQQVVRGVRPNQRGQTRWSGTPLDEWDRERLGEELKAAAAAGGARYTTALTSKGGPDLRQQLTRLPQYLRHLRVAFLGEPDGPDLSPKSVSLHAGLKQFLNTLANLERKENRP